jgi:hypothetical protein
VTHHTLKQLLGARYADFVAITDTVYTLAEVAERLKVNEDTVRRMFMSEPGVIVICFPRKGRRVYRTLRIPETVLERVINRFTAAS